MNGRELVLREGTFHSKTERRHDDSLISNQACSQDEMGKGAIQNLEGAQGGCYLKMLCSLASLAIGYRLHWDISGWDYN